MDENYGLDRIVKRYDILLFDASAIFGPFNDLGLYGRTDSDAMFQKIQSMDLNIDYRKYLQNGLKQEKPFFVTPMVWREIQRQGDDYIKKNTRSKAKQFVPSLSKLDTLSKERDRLVSYFSNCGRIISLSEGESERYEIVKRRINPFLREELSEADRDFLITGFVLAIERERTALLSNDIKIFESYKEALENRCFGLTGNNFGFYKGCRGRDFFLSCLVKPRPMNDVRVHPSRVVAQG